MSNSKLPERTSDSIDTKAGEKTPSSKPKDVEISKDVYHQNKDNKLFMNLD